MLALTGGKLADCVQQLELPALFYVVYCFRHLVRRCLNVELQPEAIDVTLACSRQARAFEGVALLGALPIG